MEKFIERLFNLKEIPAIMILGIGIVCGILLFVSPNFIEILKLKEFVTEYGKYIGITFIICVVFLIIALFKWLVSTIIRQAKIKAFKKSIIQNIYNLDDHEKAILREFYINGMRNAMELEFFDEAVKSLVAKGIIYQISTSGPVYVYGSFFAYSISKIAQKYLTNELIDLPRNPNQQQLHMLLSLRPAWAKEKTKWDNLLNIF